MARLWRPVTKIMSVMPAAAASSRAYWMRGLSTTGIISFGLALVTGRNRLPKPATGKTAFLSFGIAAPQDLAQLGLIDDRHAEAARFFELGARLGSGHHIVGLLGHRSGHLVPARFERLACLFARHAGKRARQHEGLARRGGAPRHGNDRDRPRQSPDHLPVDRLLR